MIRTSLVVIGAVLIGASPSMAAKTTKPQQPDSTSLSALARCKTITVDAERLQCYDTAAPALLNAEQRADVIVVDRAEVESARKSLFGLALPDLSLFKHRGVAMPEIQQVEGVLASASANISGQWLFRLQDGAAWQQTDVYDIGRTPRAGDKVVVKRAAVGSFKLSVNGAPAVRVRRVT